MRLLSSVADITIQSLKWPLGILMLLLLFPSSEALKLYFFNYVRLNHLLPFIAGAVGYCVIFFGLMYGQHSIFSVAEHELTHMLFAVLTFHKPADLDIGTKSQGGYFSFIGRGNFLITLAPYFFPTFIVVLMIASSWIKMSPSALQGLFGFFAAYHFISVFQEIHPFQTDLQKSGFFYSFIFLPTLNIWALASIVAFAYQGGKGVETYINILYKSTIIFYNAVLNLGQI